MYSLASVYSCVPFSHIIRENSNYFVFIVKTIHNHTLLGENYTQPYTQLGGMMLNQKGKDKRSILPRIGIDHWTGCPCFSPVER